MKTSRIIRCVCELCEKHFQGSDPRLHSEVEAEALQCENSHRTSQFNIVVYRAKNFRSRSVINHSKYSEDADLETAGRVLTAEETAMIIAYHHEESEAVPEFLQEEYDKWAKKWPVRDGMGQAAKERA